MCAIDLEMMQTSVINQIIDWLEWWFAWSVS